LSHDLYSTSADFVSFDREDYNSSLSSVDDDEWKRIQVTPNDSRVRRKCVSINLPKQGSKTGEGMNVRRDSLLLLLLAIEIDFQGRLRNRQEINDNDSFSSKQ
jgi:hypothetical protein